MEPSVSLFGPIDALLAPIIPYILLGLLVLNIAGRALEHKRHQTEAETGKWRDISRHPLRVSTSLLLVVGSFYYMTVHHHGGIVFSILVLGIFITDLFEIESRQVEVRREIDLQKPKAAIAASMLALLYILYQTLFFVVKPVWSAFV